MTRLCGRGLGNNAHKTTSKLLLCDYIKYIHLQYFSVKIKKYFNIT